LSGPDIFISYARADEDVARLVALAFEQEGFNVWWDAALHSGETFDEVIEKELRAAKAVVVLWSPRSVSSRWVRAEATLADRNRTLAPAIIEPCDRPIIFELTHTVDLTNWTGDTNDPVWQAYLYDIRRLIGDRGAATDAAPAAAPKPTSRPIARPMARPAAPPPQPQADGLSGANMESLMSAISSLQQALHQSGGQAPAPPSPAPSHRAPEPEPEDESEATQIYTGSDVYAMIEGDELHCLELEVEGTVEQRYVVGPLGLKIGRTPPADVVLADGKVSRSHCLVELKDGLVYVSDLKSTNGTFVDGKRVDGAAILPLDAVLMVGRFALTHRVRTRDELR